MNELMTVLFGWLVFTTWAFMVGVYMAIWAKAFGYGWLTSIILGVLSTLPVIGWTTLAVLAFSKWTGDKE